MKKGDPKEFVLKNFEEMKFVDNVVCSQRGQLRLFRFHPFVKYMASKIVCSVPSQQYSAEEQAHLLSTYQDRVKIKQPHIMYSISAESQKIGKPTQYGNIEMFQIGVYFEYAQLTLHDLTLSRYKQKYLFPEVEVWCLIKGVIQAMHYFQTHQITHGMLSPKTIYFDEEYLLYRLYDMEMLSGKWSNWIKYHTTKDPDIFVLLAPETRGYINQDVSVLEALNPYKADVYAFGITMFQTLTLLQQFDSPVHWLEQFYSKNLLNFLQSCIHPDPLKRLDWLALQKLPLEPSNDNRIQDINVKISNLERSIKK